NFEKPPSAVARVYTAVFLLLQVGSYSVFERYLGPAMDVFPNDPYAPGCYFPERKLDELSLWDFVRSSIQLSPRHPEHLVRLLNQASKNELCVADIEDRKLQADAAESLCQGVEREVVARTTVIGGLLVDWMQLSFHQWMHAKDGSRCDNGGGLHGYKLNARLGMILKLKGKYASVAR
ncbi:hypothetical protein CYMTET_31888, partial [Cymbomonas tetramitiformis]